MNKIVLLIACVIAFNANAQIHSVTSAPKYSIKEGKSGFIIVAYAGTAMSHTMTLNYTLTGKNSGAVVGTDLSNLSHTGAIVFPANQNKDTFTYDIVADNLTEGNDTFIFKLTSAATMGTIGTSDSVMFIILDSTITSPNPVTSKPLRTIAQMRSDANSDGESDSLNVSCTLRGIVHGVNFRTTGYQFSLTDGTGWISIYSTKNYSGLSAGLKEGDTIEVRGKMDDFNGLAQLNFSATGDTIFIISNKSARTPEIVSSLDEFSESRLVKLENLTLTSGAWFPDSVFNIKMQNTVGTVFEIRINNKPSANFSASPLIISGKKYSLTGLGGQFDNSLPKTSGYQLIPRKSSDIVVTGNAGITATETNNLSIYPSIVSNSITLNFNATKNELATIQFIDLQGRVAKSLLAKIIVGENQMNISDLNTLPNGLYILDLKGEQISIQSKMTISK